MSFGMPRYNRQADRRTEKHTPGGQIKASQVIGTTGRYNKRTDRAAGRQAGRQADKYICRRPIERPA